MNINIQSMLVAMKNLGHTVFEDDSKPYNLNIVGVRAADLDTVDQFNDLKCIFWKYQGTWSFLVQRITTKPGLFYLNHAFPGQKSTAILKEGQYPGAYMVGNHFDGNGNAHPALIQKGNLTIFRDPFFNGKFDLVPGSETTGSNYCIDQHGIWNGVEFSTVSNWSAGCQVTANFNDHALFMQLCNLSKDTWGNSFTYTLINEKDISFQKI